MSRTATALRSGEALVRLTDGRVYKGHVVEDGYALRIDGQLQVVALTGTTYRKRRKLTVPMRRVHSITWQTPG